MAKLVRFNEETVSLSEMADGDVAEIIKWHDNREVGKIIQRFGDTIIFIGEPHGNSYPNLLSWEDVDEECRVRILPPGTLIIL